MGFIVVAMAIGVLIGFYIRRAPVTPKSKEDVPDCETELTAQGSFTIARDITDDADNILARLTKIALATPRTEILSDDPLQFVTRSKAMGFPDITYAAIHDGRLVLHASLVFGRKDFGVNKARILDWLDRLGPL